MRCKKKKKKKKRKEKNHFVCLNEKLNGEAEVCQTHLYREVSRIYLSYCLNNEKGDWKISEFIYKRDF